MACRGLVLEHGGQVPVKQPLCTTNASRLLSTVPIAYDLPAGPQSASHMSVCLSVYSSSWSGFPASEPLQWFPPQCTSHPPSYFNSCFSTIPHVSLGEHTWETSSSSFYSDPVFLHCCPLRPPPWGRNQGQAKKSFVHFRPRPHIPHPPFCFRYLSWAVCIIPMG